MLHLTMLKSPSGTILATYATRRRFHVRLTTSCTLQMSFISPILWLSTDRLSDCLVKFLFHNTLMSAILSVSMSALVSGPLSYFHLLSYIFKSYNYSIELLLVETLYFIGSLAITMTDYIDDICIFRCLDAMWN